MKNADVSTISQYVAAELSIDTELAKRCLTVALQNIVTLNCKQHDYGPANLTKFGPFGVTVRMSDKLERIVNLQKQAALGAKNEPLSDSYLDLSNYALIAYVMSEKLWP